MADFANSCRLCLQREGLLESLISSNPHDLVTRALEDIFKIKLSHNDSKPNQICKFCKDKLIDFYIFYLRVENNERKIELDKPQILVKMEPNENGKRQTTTEENLSDDDCICLGEIENTPIDLISDNVKSEIQESVKTDRNVIKEELVGEFSMEVDLNDFEASSEVCSMDKINTQCVVVLNEMDQASIDKYSISPPPLRDIPIFKNFMERLLFLKQNPNLNDKDMIRVFYELKCDTCKTECPSFDELSKHNQTEHKIEKTKLSCCGVSLIKPILVSHVKHHLGLGKSSLKTHVRQLQTSLICEECGQLFAKEFNYMNHLQICQDKTSIGKSRSFNKRKSTVTFIESKIHCCDICGKSYFENRSLELHKEMHRRELDGNASMFFSCDLCDAKFTKKFFMIRHKEINHLKMLRYECDMCEEKFGWAMQLRAHTNEKHSIHKAKTCDICDQPFDSWKAIKKHRYKHMNVEELREASKFECDLCHKRFIDKHSISKHIHTSHLKSYTYTNKCDVCNKTVGRSGYQIHRASHLPAEEREALKKFTCKYCNQKFWHNFQLTSHLKSNHTCEKCLKFFKTYKLLCDHKLEIHGIEENPNNKRSLNYPKMPIKKCEFCDKSFNCNVNYKSHMYEWHLGGFLYECSNCNYKSNYKKSFKEHCLKIHNLNIPYTDIKDTKSGS